MSKEYKVLTKFRDLQDKERIYNVDDIYEGAQTAERLAELSTTNNKIGKVLIEEVKNVVQGNSDDSGLPDSDAPENTENDGSPDSSDTPEASGEADSEFPKHSGGGYYELSNGEKVRGQEAALEAEKALHDEKVGD